MTSNGQAFCLKLNSHSNHLIKSFAKLYNDQSMVDCTISCQGGMIKCHKLILSSCSPYFSSIFESFTNPYQYPVVVIKDMPLANMKIITDFMYKGEVTIPQASLASVLESAKELEVTGLCDIKIANFQSKPAPGLPSMSSEKKRKYSSGSLHSRVRNGKESKTQIEVAQDDSDQEIEDHNHDHDEIHEAEVVDDEEQEDVVEGDLEEEDGEELLDDQSGDKELVDDYEFDPSEPATSVSPNKKAELRARRIERLQQDVSSGGVSAGRKIWTDDEIRYLITKWDEESARVWASAGSKTLSMKRISESLQQMGIDRDVSQVEGKIKSMRRDWKAHKDGNAIPVVYKRISPYMEQLKKIFERDHE